MRNSHGWLKIKAMAWVLWLFLFGIYYQSNAFAETIRATETSLNEIQKKVIELKKALGDTKAEKEAATEALKASEVAISQSQKKLYELSIESTKNEKKQAELSKQLTNVKAKLADQKAALSHHLYQQYTLGKQDYLQLLLQNKTPNERARDLAYFGYLSRAHTENIQDLNHNLTKLTNLNAEIKDALEHAQQLEAKQVARKATLEKQKNQKAEVVTLLANKVDAQQTALEKLKHDEQNLTALMVKLQQQAVAAKKRKQAQQREKSKSQTIATNDFEPDDSTNISQFSKLKGKLRLPIRGELINRFGQQRTETGITWKGLFIKAKEGTRVKSIAPGKVVFANWMRGFGNLIIIDHGQGYMSLYGNNETLLKSVGATVKSGDTIAAVGNTGGNQHTGLYYELRRKSKPFDPLGWSRIKK